MNSPLISDRDLFIPSGSLSVWCWSALDISIATIATLLTLLLTSYTTYSADLSALLAERLSVKNFILLTCFLILWTGMHQALGLYNDGQALGAAKTAWRAIGASLAGSLFFFLFPLFSNERGRSVYFPVVIFLVIAATTSVSARGLLRSIVAGLRCVKRDPIRALIVGSGPLAFRQYCSLMRMSTPPYEILGFIDSPGPHTMPGKTRESLLGSLTALESILMSTAVDEVMLALPLRSCFDKCQETITICERMGVAVSYYVQPFQHSVGVSRIQRRDMDTHVSRHPSRIHKWQPTKEILDYIGAAIALSILMPLLIATAIAIKISSPGPVLFVQERYGLNKKRFRMFKFRTMVTDAESLQETLETLNEATGPVFKIRSDPRITPIGRLLRKLSIDELPQLINVLKGDMSLVGPRPLPIRDVNKFADSWLMRRFSVKPGLTCLWQVNGRSDTNFDRWIAYDLEYIDTWSPLLDVKILIRTIPAVLRGSGAV